MTHLSIRVLGPLEVSLDGAPVSGFASDKVRALLAYLALSPGRAHRREVLAGLLWPNYPERSARASLRNALANLRRAIGDGAASPPYVLSTRQTIEFNSQSDHWLDAVALEDLLARAPGSCEDLEQAIGLVRGLMLEGFSLTDAAPFEEWLLLRREQFGRRMVEALGKLALAYEGEGHYGRALAHAWRRVELEPWQGEGQRQVMRLLALSGRRSQALAQYETFRRSLREELGAEPSAHTKALWQAILAGDVSPEPALRPGPGPPLPIWNLPAATTPFFGREEELATLVARLAEKETRHVSLVGLGGCGKTRVALELGSRLAEQDRQSLAGETPLTFAHGIVFVPLAAVESVEGLEPVLADALRLPLKGGRDQLLEFLRPKQLLLILDNLEHLPGAAGLLAEILRTAPRVKILATSRERLQIGGEHVLPLGGLPYPDSCESRSVPGAADVEGILAGYPAVQLLAGAVQRVRSGFAPSAMELPAMVDICRMVDGLPLALELAASWADALSLEEVLAEARRGLDFWEVDWPDLPQRQRSMRAVFDVSWRRLGPVGQAAFSSLTVFRGGFTREAVGWVLGGAREIPRLLATLVRKSFLQYDRTKDRYGVHELLRQYGAEKLAQEPADETRARERHGTYYLDVLRGWESDLYGSRQRAALREMEAESENVRAAWQWAVEQAQVERLDAALDGLDRFYRLSGRHAQAKATLGAAAEAALAASETTPDGARRATLLRVAVRALALLSDTVRALGGWEEAQRLQERCRTILKDPALRGCDTRLERAMLASVEGMATVMADHAQARERFRESFDLFRRLVHRRGMAMALASWGYAAAHLGYHQEARERLEQSLAMYRAQYNLSGVATTFHGLAYLARVEGRFEEAEALAQEAHTTALEAGSRHEAGVSQAYLAHALRDQGKFSEAHSSLQQSQALFGELGHRSFVTQGDALLGITSMHLGHHPEARDHAQAALAMALEHGPQFTVGLSLLLLGCLDLADGAPDSAHRHVQDSIAVYRERGPRDELSWALSVLAMAALGRGDRIEARQHLTEAFQIAVGLRTVPKLLWALPATALLLASEGENERAVELYALASRYPFVARSQWFADVAGDTLAGVAANLPAERVAVLQERGRARDLEATVAELLSELRM